MNHQLIHYARKIYSSPKYKIQKIADKFGAETFSIKILFLPVAHSELNPIEMVWSFLKRSVASRKLKFNLSAVEELTREHIFKVTAELFNKFYIHACREEGKYRELSITTDT